MSPIRVHAHEKSHGEAPVLEPEPERCTVCPPDTQRRRAWRLARHDPGGLLGAGFWRRRACESASGVRRAVFSCGGWASSNQLQEGDMRPFVPAWVLVCGDTSPLLASHSGGNPRMAPGAPRVCRLQMAGVGLPSLYDQFLALRTSPSSSLARAPLLGLGGSDASCGKLGAHAPPDLTPQTPP